MKMYIIVNFYLNCLVVFVKETGKYTNKKCCNSVKKMNTWATERVFQESSW